MLGYWLGISWLIQNNCIFFTCFVFLGFDGGIFLISLFGSLWGFLGGGCGVLGFYCGFYLFVGLGGFVFLFGEDWGGSNFSFLFVLGFLVGFVVSNGGRF